jgi:hypothetical protein
MLFGAGSYLQDLVPAMEHHMAPAEVQRRVKLRPTSQNAESTHVFERTPKFRPERCATHTTAPTAELLRKPPRVPEAERGAVPAFAQPCRSRTRECCSFLLSGDYLSFP